jgi:membrane dipeptidase
MGITGVRNFVSPKEPTTIENVLDHYDHVAKLVGVEHVGVGSDIDLDGYDALPDDYKKSLRNLYKSSYAFRDKLDTDGVNHYKRMFDITDGLIRTDPRRELPPGPGTNLECLKLVSVRRPLGIINSRC